MKKSFENEIAFGMQKELYKIAAVQEGPEKLPQAIEYLNSAIDILQHSKLDKEANQLLNILIKFAQLDNNDIIDKKELSYANGLNDKAISNLSTDRMTQNLKDHGTVFNLNEHKTNKILDKDVFDLDINEADDFDEDFEDE